MSYDDSKICLFFFSFNNTLRILSTYNKSTQVYSNDRPKCVGLCVIYYDIEDVV